MSKDLAALLDNLPEIKADDYAHLSKQKRWELRLTDEQRERRRKIRNAQRRQKYRANKAFRLQETSRVMSWYWDRGKLLRHGS